MLIVDIILGGMYALVAMGMTLQYGVGKAGIHEFTELRWITVETGR